MMMLSYVVPSGEAKEEQMLEKKIHKDILTGYNSDVRPEPAHNVPLHVHFDNRLQKLVALNVKEQLFTVNAFILMRWTDPQLAWNASNYDGIDKINLGTNLIWTPDIMLYNTAHEESFGHYDLYKTKALVYNTGEIVWTAPVTWRVSCAFDVTWFPVDKQICNLTFGSWSYMSGQIQLSPWNESLTKEQFQHENFMIQSGEWLIDDFKSYILDLKYVCCPDPFSVIVYEIHVKRMSLYYFLYIILPLISQVFLFLMIFHIPTETGERMGFGVTILLSITVYLLVISEKLPEKSDDKPMLGICFICEFYILSAALVASAITMNLAKKKTDPPNYLKVLTGFCKKSFRRPTTAPEAIPMCETNGQSLSEDNNGLVSVNSNCCKHCISRNRAEENNNFEWRRIANILDKYFFYTFVLLVLFVPVIIVSTLDHSHLGAS